MATQTRRTTRGSARFFSATVTGRMVVACCSLVLMSVVAAHADLPLNGLPMNGLPYNGLPINGMPFNGFYVNGIPMNGMPFNGVVLNGAPVNGMPFNGASMQGLPHHGLLSKDIPSTERVLTAPVLQQEPLPTGPQESLPWNGLSQRALGDAAANDVCRVRHCLLP